MTQNTRRAVLVAAAMTLAVPMTILLIISCVTFLIASSASGWSGVVYSWIGVTIAVLAALASIPVAARSSFARSLPRGARLRPALACGLATAAVLFTSVGLVGITIFPAHLMVVLLPLPILLPLALTSHLRWRWVVATVAILAVVTFVVSTVQESARDARDEVGQLANLTPFGTALPLVGGRTLQDPQPGWELITVFLPVGPDSEVGVLWRSDVGTAAEVGHHLLVTQTSTDCFADGATCTVVGDGPHGLVRRYRDASYVFVEVEGIEWQLTGATDAEAVVVLNNMDGVAAERFLAIAVDAI